MRRNILHLIDTGGPGGAETIYRELVTRLPEDRWTSVAAVPVRDWLYESLLERGHQPVLLPTQGAFDYRYVMRIYRLARSMRANVIHAHLLAASVYGTAAAMLLRIPLVSTFHGLVDVGSSEKYATAKLRIVNRRSNRIVFVSEALRRDFVSRHALDMRNMSVIHNGIDTAHFRPGTDTSLRRQLGIAEDELLIGAVGNVRISKAYDVLLRAAALLVQRGVPFRVVIIGQTSGQPGLFEELSRLCVDLGLESHVTFAGLRNDIADVMRNFDVYVLSSRAEGFSLTTVEAMATGLAVVATRSGGPEEIVEDGVTGLLVTSDSPEALADGLQSVAQTQQTRRDLGGAARQSVENRFSVSAMVAQYEIVYDESIRAHGRA